MMPENKRQHKAQLLFNGGVRPTETRKDTWKVPASSGPLVYEVRKDAGLFSCSCPDFTIRGDDCKHILLVTLCKAAACAHEAPKAALINNPVESDRLDIHTHKNKMLVVF
jgi:SWIM zinc finger